MEVKVCTSGFRVREGRLVEVNVLQMRRSDAHGDPSMSLGGYIKEISEPVSDLLRVSWPSGAWPEKCPRG